MPVLEGVPLLTTEDYQRLTPEWPLGPRYQLVEGELLQMSTPSRFHQEVLSNLHGIIWSYLRQHRVGVVYTSPFDVYLDQYNVFQPDLLYVSRERSDLLVREGMRGAPDLVMEILSPSTASLDRRRKAAIYARTGAGELWLVEPDAQTIEVYALEQSAEKPAAVYRFAEDAAAVIETPRLPPGLRIALADIFASPLD